jgi:hypothetical protein
MFPKNNLVSNTRRQKSLADTAVSDAPRTVHSQTALRVVFFIYLSSQFVEDCQKGTYLWTNSRSFFRYNLQISITVFMTGCSYHLLDQYQHFKNLLLWHGESKFFWNTGIYLPYYIAVVFNLGYAYPRGYIKLKKIYILFHDKHWIIRARFWVSHKRPGCKDMRFGRAISLSLSLSPLCDSYLGG